MSPLLSPLRFVAIRHGKWVRYNIVLPGAAGAVATGMLLFWPNVPTLLGEKGTIAQLASPLAVLGGFFVAALTLVTADRSEIMKAPIGGEHPPKLAGESLSRRRFLAFLFGYLSFSCFALLGISMFATTFGRGFVTLMPQALTKIAEGGFTFAISYWLAHVGTATLLGLYYFTERLQVSDRRVIVGKLEAEATPAE